MTSGFVCLFADEALQTTEGSSWRDNPGDFGIGGRYPVKEVFSAAYEAWKGRLHAAQDLDGSNLIMDTFILSIPAFKMHCTRFTVASLHPVSLAPSSQDK